MSKIEAKELLLKLGWVEDKYDNNFFIPPLHSTIRIFIKNDSTCNLYELIGFDYKIGFEGIDFNSIQEAISYFEIVVNDND